MNYYHFTNDLSFEINLSSVATGETLDPSVIRQVRLFTRKNGRVYCACFGNNTLINNGNTLTVVLNNHGLEPGVLQYVVEMQIPDPIYPDNFKKVSQFYVSEIELVKGQGLTDYADVQAMYGTTIDSKFQDMELELDNLDEDVQDIQATIVSVQEITNVQNSSINAIEDILSGISGDESASITRLDTSVNQLTGDVSDLKDDVSTLSSEVETMSDTVSANSNDIDDISTKINGIENTLPNKADVSLLGNYYTTGETYTKSEVDRAIADAALDGQLPAGVVVDADYVHTDNNYTTEDKNKVRDFDLTGYPTNSSLVANYATKAELQNVDNNHPTNASVNSNYLKKSELANELSDYVQNASLVANYATKAQIQGCLDEDEVYGILEDYPTNSSVSDNYVHWLYANLNYVSYENIDEIIINTVDNNYTFQNKVIDVINTSTAVKDIPVLSTNIQNVSTKLTSDYLTAQTVNADFVKNASLNTELTKYVLKSTAEETYLTSDDISTFKPIVFCTQEEYDALVENNQVDPNTVYMLSGDQTGGDYLTPDDVSNFVTTDDISTFITENDVSNFVTDSDLDDYLTADDASIYVKEDFGALSTDTKKTIVKYEDSSNFGELSFYILNNAYNGAHSFNGNILKFDSYNVKKTSKPYYLQRIAFNGMWGTTYYNGNNYGSITFMRGISNSSVFNDNLEWGNGNYNEGSDFKWATIFVDDDGFGLLKYLGYSRVVTRYATTNQLTDVSNYVSTNYASKNDISTFITSNDVSVYATTSYVDTQIGNIQNILSTI